MVKRERSVNWESGEKQLLLEIVRPYIAIIENKDMSTDIKKAKNNAWIEIVEKFNAANTWQRDKKQLLNQWNLIKISSKREMSLFCKYLIKTEGKLKPEDKEMMPQEFQMDSKDLLQIIDNEPVMNTNKRRSPKKCSFNFWKSSYQDMHRFRVLRDKRLQQEHEIRMKNMAELQSQAMENLKLQYEFLKKTESQM